MNRRFLFLALIGSILIFMLGCSNTKADNPNQQSKNTQNTQHINTHHISLQNDKKAYERITNDMYVEGYKNYFDKTVTEMSTLNSSLEMDIEFSPLEDSKMAEAEGDGVISIEGKQYPFEFEGQNIGKDTTLDKQRIYFGPITTSIKMEEKTNIIIGLEYIPSEDQATASVTIGQLNPTKGTAFLFYGEPIVSRELSEKIYGGKDE